MKTAKEIIDTMRKLGRVRTDLQLARLLKVNKNTVATWRRRKNVPLEIVFQFCQDNNVDPIWLLTGRATTKYAEIDGQEAYCVLTTPEIRDRLEQVEELTRERNEALQEVATLKACASVDEWVSDGFCPIPVCNTEVEGEPEEVKPKRAIDLVGLKGDWIRKELKTEASSLSIFFISGDSMDPTLRHGDIVLVDKKRSKPEDGGIYIIRIGDRVIFRRVQLMKDGTIVARSDHPRYEPIHINPREDKDVAFVGRVLWVATRIA